MGSSQVAGGCLPQLTLGGDRLHDTWDFRLRASYAMIDVQQRVEEHCESALFLETKMNVQTVQHCGSRRQKSEHKH